MRKCESKNILDSLVCLFSVINMIDTCTIKITRYKCRAYVALYFIRNGKTQIIRKPRMYKNGGTIGPI